MDMRFRITQIFLLSLLSLNLFAQKTGKYLSEVEDPYINVLSVYKSHSFPLNENDLDGEFTRFLQSEFPDLSFEFEYFIESPGGFHVNFIQTHKSYPIFNHFVKINLDRSFKVISTISLTEENGRFPEYQLESLNTSVDGLGFEELEEKRSEYVWYVNPRSGQIEPAYSSFLFDPTDHQFENVVFGNNGLILHRDLNCYLPDSAISVSVFNPDPLTTANQVYGAPYVDDQDNDVLELNAERRTLTVTGNFDGSLFTAENDFVKISELSAPANQPISKSIPVFNESRSMNGFEDANVLYHITEYQLYIQSLGFNNLVNYQLPVDPHALSGQDNSLFSFSSNPPILLFGEGGVDDAEDADVIIHEYGHAVSFSAAPNSNTGLERSSLDEGFGDYLATSYSRFLNEYAWERMFTWDGHNEFWNGRNASSSKLYKRDLGSSIHANGEIWNSTLMEIWEQLGRDSTDRLVLQSMYGYASNMDYYAAASLLLQADTLLYGARNFCVIYPILLNRGMIRDTVLPDPCSFFDPSIPVFAGTDTTICVGRAVLLGGDPTTSAGNTVTWSPDLYLTDNEAFNPIATPTDSISYFVTSRDDQGFFNTDQININVVICPDQPILLNSAAFANGLAPLTVRLPIGFTEARARVYDAVGNLIYDGEFEGQNEFSIPIDFYAAGVYVAEIRFGDNERASLKAVRYKE